MRYTLRRLMVIVALVALAMTIIVQAVRLREAAMREQRLRAELERQNTLVMYQRALQAARSQWLGQGQR